MIPYTQGVYKIENQENDKVYIGSTNNLNLRRNNHFSDLRHDRASNSHLQNAWKKYGEGNFIFEALEEFSGETEELREREKHWINELNSTDREQGYNVRSDPTTNEGFNHSEATKQKISEIKKGVSIDYTMTDEERAWRAKRCKEFRPGDHMTEEQREKMLKNLRKAVRGSSNNNAKLNEEQAKAIKILIRDSNLTHQEIADKFPVSHSTVEKISMGTRWAHVKVEEAEEKVSL